MIWRPWSLFSLFNTYKDNNRSISDWVIEDFDFELKMSYQLNPHSRWRRCERLNLLHSFFHKLPKSQVQIKCALGAYWSFEPHIQFVSFNHYLREIICSLMITSIQNKVMLAFRQLWTYLVWILYQIYSSFFSKFKIVSCQQSQNICTYFLAMFSRERDEIW